MRWLRQLLASLLGRQRGECHWQDVALDFGNGHALEASQRGLRLLKQNLTAEQRRQYCASGYFDVVGGATGRHYRIRNGYQLNIDVLDNFGRRRSRLCFAPRGNLVLGDVLLAQKLALELYEHETLAVANSAPGTRLAGY